MGRELGRCIALVDCNNFYVSCERRFNRALRDMPVVVLSSNDGCIIARSEEAKALGVAMGAPLFKVRDTLRQQGVRVLSANFELYTDISAKIIGLLEREAPKVEVYSIDEAFLELDGMSRYVSAETFCHRLRQQVWEELEIPVSIGIGPSKVLAKVANRLAKKAKTTYVGTLMDAQQHEAVLRNLPVGDVWGVGWRIAERLKAAGIQNAWQLRELSLVHPLLHSVMETRVVKELRGQSCLEVEEDHTPKVQIGSSRSFGRPVTALYELEEAVCHFISLAALKLRKQRSAAQVITVSLRTNRFAKEEDYVKQHRSIRLAVAKCSTPELLKPALQLVREMYRPGLRYKKAAVMLTGIEPEAAVQANLFAPAPRQRLARLDHTTDELNARFREMKVYWGRSSGLTPKGQRKDWMPLSEQRSEHRLPDVTEAERDRTRPWW